ncbi:MAG: hypothetical protein WKF77_04300 [Planctomycetaceae bacterium]
MSIPSDGTTIGAYNHPAEAYSAKKILTPRQSCLFVCIRAIPNGAVVFIRNQVSRTRLPKLPVELAESNRRTTTTYVAATRIM